MADKKIYKHQHNNELYSIEINTNGISALHDVKNVLAETISEFDKLWKKWEEPIFTSTLQEKKRLFHKKEKFFIGIDESKTSNVLWEMIKSALYNVDRDIKEEYLLDTLYLISKKDGNVYYIDYDKEQKIFTMRYFIEDTLYEDCFRIFYKRGGYYLQVIKWIKFPFPIRAISFSAQQAALKLEQQWQHYKKNIKEGLRKDELWNE